MKTASTVPTTRPEGNTSPLPEVTTSSPATSCTVGQIAQLQLALAHQGEVSLQDPGTVSRVTWPPISMSVLIRVETLDQFRPTSETTPPGCLSR